MTKGQGKLPRETQIPRRCSGAELSVRLNIKSIGSLVFKCLFAKPGLIEFGDDAFGRVDRIVGLGDRTANHQNIRSACNGIFRRHDAFLIVA